MAKCVTTKSLFVLAVFSDNTVAVGFAVVDDDEDDSGDSQ